MQPHKVIIKKYENRRLYDTAGSRYVNLEEVAQMVRDGTDVQVVDAATGEDLTRLILTQIIMEEAKGRDSAFPLDMLRQMVMTSGATSQEALLKYMKTDPGDVPERLPRVRSGGDSARFHACDDRVGMAGHPAPRRAGTQARCRPAIRGERTSHAHRRIGEKALREREAEKGALNHIARPESGSIGTLNQSKLPCSAPARWPPGWCDIGRLAQCEIDTSAASVESGLAGAAGSSRSGIGFAANKRWQGFASQRAQRLELFRLALSVEMPVFAYICR